MPVEIIGEAGTAGASRERINAECEIALKHLKRVRGEPPPEMELEVHWQEHDLKTYPLIVLVWEDGMCGAPWEYVEKCEAAFAEYDIRYEVSNFESAGRTCHPVTSKAFHKNAPIGACQ